MSNAYDSVPYLITSFPESHPSRLQGVAHLFGLDAPATQTARVLELGCAVGGNIVPMAYALPDARFVGIDIVASQIELARQFADGAGVKNVDFRAVSITDITPQWGEFDYILCHGVYAWVPPDVQEKVLQICARQLSPRGVAYISFNTYPGWHVRMWARDAMLFHADGIADPIQRARAGRDFVTSLRQSPMGGGVSTLLQGEVQYLEGKPESYILHEYLEEWNQPMYFRDFARRCAQAGVQYVGDAMHNGAMAEPQPWPPMQQWAAACGEDLVRLEQYWDFARNRMFRRAIVCRAGETLDRKSIAQRAESMWVVSFLRQWAEGNGMSRFEHPRGGRLVTGPGVLRDALINIARRFPNGVRFSELVNAASAGAERAALQRELVNCWMNGMLELYLDEPRFRTDPGDRPATTPVARYLAAHGSNPVNLRHESIPVDPNQRKLITLLDGTRTREQLAKDMAVPREVIDRALAALVGVALLVD